MSFLMDVALPKRSRVRGEVRKNKRHRVAVKYFLISPEKERIPVCSKFFVNLFGVGQRRLNTIADGILSGNGVVEKRGGDHKLRKFSTKREKVYEFISKLRACESHYARNKSRRLYLHSSLNINRLFCLYNTTVEDEFKVKKTFFVKIFETKFNLGFGSPASDTCSYCSRLKTEIHSCANGAIKEGLILDFVVHKKRAKAFHTLMKENPEASVTYVFDLQQVQAIPKVTIGEAFYARQISFYSFCVTDVATKNPHFYVWNETQASRGAQEISSALIDFLEKAHIDVSINKIRLFADGCGGQNKNQHVVHALTYWLQKKSPKNIKEIIMYFPVRGHSYLPADRVFGRVEKNLRKTEEVLNPEAYIKIYKESGIVRILGEDWFIKNYKDLKIILKQIDGISDMKRIFLQKCIKNGNVDVKIKLEPTYMFDDTSKQPMAITKRGRTLMRDMQDRCIIPLLNRMKEEKKNDVRNLLCARFGQDWEDNIPLSSLMFFSHALNTTIEADAETADPVDDVREEQAMCDCLEEDPPQEQI